MGGHARWARPAVRRAGSQALPGDNCATLGDAGSLSLHGDDYHACLIAKVGDDVCEVPVAGLACYRHVRSYSLQ